MAALGKQFHAAERLVFLRAARNPNDVIKEAETLSERVAACRHRKTVSP
ncbi:MAG: hypothetical protein Q7T90_11590 [Thiobacillus sp.]|nr:hypothetical protein [Thiobacillus sp.]